MRRFLGTIFATATLIFVCIPSAELIAKPKKYAPVVFDLGKPALPTGEVAFINGINHKPDRALKCSSLLSSMAGGCNVYTIYNPTDGLLEDLRQCFFELVNFRTSAPVFKLHEKWDEFFSNCKRDDEFFLQFCHSQGAIQVRNALMLYPPELRERIVVVAIAPGAYITQNLCGKVFHYVSRRDIVPLFDRRGKRLEKDTLIRLNPHPTVRFFDHHFLSPTYRTAIHHHLKQYVKINYQ